jgi:hypothetical protein
LNLNRTAELFLFGVDNLITSQAKATKLEFLMLGSSCRGFLRSAKPEICLLFEALFFLIVKPFFFGGKRRSSSLDGLAQKLSTGEERMIEL